MAEGRTTRLTHEVRGDRKYQFMEVSTQRRLEGLREKVPDIQSTLDMVQFLETRKVGRSLPVEDESGMLRWACRLTEVDGVDSQIPNRWRRRLN